MKMYFSLIILCASFSIFSCEAAAIDYSNITPWSVVYAVYPMYDSDPWVEVWKNERSLLISDNTVDYGSNTQQSIDSNIHKESLDHNNSRQDNQIGNRNNQQLNSNQPPQTHSWPLNLRNWPKNSNKPDN